MHLKRLLVALVILPILYIYIMYLPPAYFLLLLTCVSVVAMLEFYSMYRVTGILKYMGLFFGVSILCGCYIVEEHIEDIILLSVMAIMGVRLLFKRNPVSSLSEISTSVVGLLYIPGLLSFQIEIRQFGPEWVILLYACVWASDTMAYCLGKAIGKRKLYAEVSPNKTVAGAVGSPIGGVVAAIILKNTLIPGLTIAYALLIGIISGIISIIGDLVESMLKRDAKVKDSSTIIPAHGGILDKVDGVLFAGPVLYWLIIGL